MRKKNWVMPGILMLSVLLLLSFPVIAMAEENTETEQVVVNEQSPTAEPATVEQTTTDISNAEEAATSADAVTADDKIVETAPIENPIGEQETSDTDESLPDNTSPQNPEIVEAPNDNQSPTGDNDAGNTPSDSQPGEEPAVDEPVKDEPVVENPDVVSPDVVEPGDWVIDEDTPRPIPIHPDGNGSSNQGEDSVTTTPPACGQPSTTKPISNEFQSDAPSVTVPDKNPTTEIDGGWSEPVTAVDSWTGKGSSISNDNTGNHNASNINTGEDSGINKSRAPFVNYLVRKGESLWLIGKNFGVDFLEIMKANNLKDFLIYPDQELIIPGVTTQDGKVVYRIKLGDTFYLIAKALGLDFKDIMELNGYDDIWIYPEDTLLIPEKTETAALLSSTVEAKAIIAAVGSDLELLARAIYAEARGESFEGQIAVGAVILNRLEAAGFPKSVKDIIYQPGAFTAVDDGQINLVPDAEAFRAAQEALDGADPSLGALYYWNPDIATSTWIWSRPIIKQIGDHVFAR